MKRFLALLMLLLPAAPALRAQNIPVISGLFVDDLELVEPLLRQDLSGIAAVRIVRTDFMTDTVNGREKLFAIYTFDKQGRLTEQAIWPNDSGAMYTVKTKWLANGLRESKEETAPTKSVGMTRTFSTYSYSTGGSFANPETVTKIEENGASAWEETKTWSDDSSVYYVKTKDVRFANDKSESFRADGLLLSRTWMGEQAQYFYDSLGWLKKIFRRPADPNDLRYINELATHTKDASGRKSSTAVVYEDGPVIYTEAYSYDANGRISKLVRRDADDEGKLKPTYMLQITYEAAPGKIKPEGPPRKKDSPVQLILFVAGGVVILGILFLALRMMRRKK